MNSLLRVCVKRQFGRLALALILVLTGCATPEVRVKDYPEPPVITAPERPLIASGTPSSEVLRAAMEYILLLETRLREALVALDAYRKKGPAEGP